MDELRGNLGDELEKRGISRVSTLCSLYYTHQKFCIFHVIYKLGNTEGKLRCKFTEAKG